MKYFIIFAILAFTAITLSSSTNETYAVLSANNPFILEGSGYAVSDDAIKNSLINFDLITGKIANTRGDFTIENGFITLNDDDYIVEDLRGTILRDGRYLRISGTSDGISGNEMTFSLFGKLIQETNNGSIYSFSGKAVVDKESYKIIYTSQLSKFGTVKIPTTTTTPEKQNEITIKIFKGASTKAVAKNYIEALGSKNLASGQGAQQSYISMDRVTIKPGTIIKWVNDDTVSHSIVSGSGLGSYTRTTESIIICTQDQVKIPEGHSFIPEGMAGRDCGFTLDGRINTGKIAPGESFSVTIKEKGFYRFADPDYIWVNGVIYAFENTGSTTIGNPTNQKLN